LSCKHRKGKNAQQFWPETRRQISLGRNTDHPAPPHRSGRAVLPHPVPRLDSLSPKAKSSVYPKPPPYIVDLPQFTIISNRKGSNGT